VLIVCVFNAGLHLNWASAE